MKVELKNITKIFYTSKALDDVQLELNGGEINCLVGENGAGKSTIIKILAGFHMPDHGDIYLNGQKVIFRNPKDSQKNKVAVIHQELMLVPELSVAENIFLGHWLTKGPIINRNEMNSRARKLLDSLGTNIDEKSLVSSLSTGEQQLVEIAKALSRDCEVLVLDEPTASLSEVDADRLLNIVDDLRSKGIAVLYVSHRLEEVFRIADKITIFRDGKYVDCISNKNASKDQIVSMMVGRKVGNEEIRHRKDTCGKLALQVEGLCSGKKFHDISFDLHEGEVLGIAGLVGSGRSEILRAIYGLDRFDTGGIYVYGKKHRFSHPVQAIRNGISLVPEDRKTQGLILIQSIRNNICIGILNKLSNFGLINAKRVDTLSKEYGTKLSIKMESIHVPANSLSGGNQQKVVLARSLAMQPSILMLDEPTRGVDVGSREEIHKLIDNAVNENLAVLIVSSDIVELLDLSDRVVVLREGKIVGRFNNGEISKEEVIRLATS